MQLTTFKNDTGLEILINTETGESFASQRGYARLAGKPQSTINSRVSRMSEGERKKFVKEAEVLTPGGLQGVQCLTEDLIVEWLPKDNPEMATQLLKLGVRVFLHTEAGFKYEIKDKQTEMMEQVLSEVKALRQMKEQQMRAHPIGYDLVQDTSSVEMTTQEYLEFNEFSQAQIDAFKHTLARRAAASQRTGTGDQLFNKINSCNKLRYSYLNATAKSMGLI